VPSWTIILVGFYEGVLNVLGFSISTYDLEIYATTENHEFLGISVDIIVTPIPTRILVQEGTTSLSVIYGDILGIYVEYNDTYYGGYLDGANVSYILGGYSASMSQLPDGRYYGEINSSLFSAQTLYLRVIARKDGYAQASRTQPFNILAVPTDITAKVLTNDAYRGDMVNYTVYLNDTHTNAPITGADVTIEWSGATGTAYDLENGSYIISIFVNNSIPRLYDVAISITKLNYQTSSITVALLVKPTDAFIDSISQIDIPVNDTATVIVNLVNEFTNEVVGDINALAVWETLGSSELIPLENGSYSFSVPGDLPIGQYRVALVFSTNLYRVPSHEILVNVRQVYTDLIYGQTQIDAYPGAPVTIRITYLDTDHSSGITDVTPTVSVTEGEIVYYPERLADYDNGTYELYFEILQAYTMYIDVQFAKNDYQTQSVQFTVFSDLTPAQQAQQTAIVGGGTSLMIIAILVVLYVRVWSIPKLVRKMNKMIKALSKGKIPDPADVPSRQATVLLAVNEEIKSVGLKKAEDEVAEIPIDIRAPEVNELLARLVEITGLSEEEIQAFRRDLSRMKASERPGFLKEVIEQEEARRADELAEKEAPSKEPQEESLEQRPEDMEDLRSKLLKKGLPKDEINLILEEAKGLSKADIIALLESLGLDWD
jgi:predicted house-cleaning noncanonical NTP pyrophosphatase (MazG superfamily)